MNNKESSPEEPVEQKPFEDRLKDFINNQQDIPKEISEVVNRRFWDMLDMPTAYKEYCERNGLEGL